MKKLSALSFLFLSMNVIAQQQPERWYFGYYCALDFTSGSPVSVPGSAINQWEGVATACDTAGNLEFYSDGASVWNSNNQQMPNGFGLMGNQSSTQSATVVPVPGNMDQYYLFTCPELNFLDGFRYSIVDMSLNGGLGDVTATKNILLADSTTEQCAVIPSSDGCVWVVVRKYDPVWYAFLIDSTGINAPVISVAGSVFDKSVANGVGYMKASPLHTQIAIANYGYSASSSFFEVYDFDNGTGEVSNAFPLYLTTSVYGCEFSPDGTKFYGAEWGLNIYQYDLTAGNPSDIDASKTLIGSSSYEAVGDMQIGPNQKIYCALNNGSKLAVINDPNVLGVSCNFQFNGVYLGGNTCGIGLPSTLVYATCVNQISQVAFASSDTMLCEKFCIDFFDASLNNPTAWQWSFPGGSPTFSIDQNPTDICYAIPGTYDVTLITTNGGGSDTLTLSNYITVNPTPPFPTITQAGYTLTSSPATSYQWQFNSTDIPGATNQSYTILQTGYYTVLAGDENGCKNSATLYVLIVGVEAVNDDPNIFISPNPSNGTFTVEYSAGTGGQIAHKISIDVANTLGQVIYSNEWSAGPPSEKIEIDLRRNATYSISTGVYFIEIKTKNDLVRKKIVIE